MISGNDEQPYYFRTEKINFFLALIWILDKWREHNHFVKKKHLWIGKIKWP